MSKTRSVYFVEAGKGGPIKIGTAYDVPARIRDLQGANAKKLHLLVTVPGGHKIERQLHRRFKSERLSGEWFKGNGEVRAFIATLIAAAPEARVVELDPPRARRKRSRTGRDHLPYIPRDELHAMLTVGDGGSIYRTAEAEKYFERYVDTESIRKRQIKDERLAAAAETA